MKTNQLFLLTGLVAVTLPACVQKDKKGVSEKPMNILYIMCDDHSYQTVSAYDHRFIETPNIDRIANEGVRFTNSFVANSLSGPSRACLLTGKHSHKNGFTDNTKRFDGSQQTFPKLLRPQRTQLPRQRAAETAKTDDNVRLHILLLIRSANWFPHSGTAPPPGLPPGSPG